VNVSFAVWKILVVEQNDRKVDMAEQGDGKIETVEQSDEEN
jgi:hypothetical protein